MYVYTYIYIFIKILLSLRDKTRNENTGCNPVNAIILSKRTRIIQKFLIPFITCEYNRRYYALR
jgi:intein/homing endonuclease